MKNDSRKERKLVIRCQSADLGFLVKFKEPSFLVMTGSPRAGNGMMRVCVCVCVCVYVCVLCVCGGGGRGVFAVQKPLVSGSRRRVTTRGQSVG